MNDRERFLGTMRFEPVDRPPFCNVHGPWPDTLARWHREGFPRDNDFEAYFGVSMLSSRSMRYAGPAAGPYPPFEQAVLSENSREVIRGDSWGRTIRDFKDATTMPEWLDFPVRGPAAAIRRVAPSARRLFLPLPLRERIRGEGDCLSPVGCHCGRISRGDPEVLRAASCRSFQPSLRGRFPGRGNPH